MNVRHNFTKGLEPIEEILCSVIHILKETFKENFRALILYGSWARGSARKDSDIDLMAILEEVDKKTRESLKRIGLNISSKYIVSLDIVSLKEFSEERIPLYTAVKKEGILIFGKVDLSVDPTHPLIKYSDFFSKFKEFYDINLKTAEEILEKYPNFDVIEICFLAATGSIQNIFAINGLAYTSKIGVLMSLIKKYFGKEFAEPYERLFEFYLRYKYRMEFLSKEESILAINYARHIIKLFETEIEKL